MSGAASGAAWAERVWREKASTITPPPPSRFGGPPPPTAEFLAAREVQGIAERKLYVRSGRGGHVRREASLSARDRKFWREALDWANALLVDMDSDLQPNQQDPRRTPAEPHERVYGSRLNAPGSASQPGEIRLSSNQEAWLQGQADQAGIDWQVLAAVMRRGMGAFSKTHHPSMSRDGWGRARVAAFLHLLETGKPQKAAYTQDNDLIPTDRPRATMQPNRSKSELLAEWNALVNMTADELEEFLERPEGRVAGLSRAEADRQGIRSGQQSARAIIRMKRKDPQAWSWQDWDWAQRQVSFIKRMSGMRGPLYDEQGKPTRKLLSLMVWGHIPPELDQHYAANPPWRKVGERFYGDRVLHGTRLARAELIRADGFIRPDMVQRAPEAGKGYDAIPRPGRVYVTLSDDTAVSYARQSSGQGVVFEVEIGPDQDVEVDEDDLGELVAFDPDARDELTWLLPLAERVGSQHQSVTNPGLTLWEAMWLEDDPTDMNDVIELGNHLARAMTPQQHLEASHYVTNFAVLGPVRIVGEHLVDDLGWGAEQRGMVSNRAAHPFRSVETERAMWGRLSSDEDRARVTKRRYAVAGIDRQGKDWSLGTYADLTEALRKAAKQQVYPRAVVLDVVTGELIHD